MSGGRAVEKNIEAFCAMDFAGSSVVVGDGQLAAKHAAQLSGRESPASAPARAAGRDMPACDRFGFPAAPTTFRAGALSRRWLGLAVADRFRDRPQRRPRAPPHTSGGRSRPALWTRTSAPRFARACRLRSQARKGSALSFYGSTRPRNSSQTWCESGHQAEGPRQLLRQSKRRPSDDGAVAFRRI